VAYSHDFETDSERFIQFIKQLKLMGSIQTDISYFKTVLRKVLPPSAHHFNNMSFYPIISGVTIGDKCLAVQRSPFLFKFGEDPTAEAEDVSLKEQQYVADIEKWQAALELNGYQSQTLYHTAQTRCKGNFPPLETLHAVFAEAASAAPKKHVRVKRATYIIKEHRSGLRYSFNVIGVNASLGLEIKLMIEKMRPFIQHYRHLLNIITESEKYFVGQKVDGRLPAQQFRTFLEQYLETLKRNPTRMCTLPERRDRYLAER